MAQVYRDLGMDLGDPARDAMQAMLEAERQKPKDVHIHSPEGFGFTPKEIRGRLQGYCERFDL